MPKFARVAPTGNERRKAPRYRPAVILPALLGRHDAIVADLSTCGARVFHFATIKRGDMLRFTMHYGEHVFSSLARVLSSAIEALGTGPSGAATYESRLQFVDPGSDEKAILASLLIDLQERQAERWVRNAKGEYAAEQLPRVVAYYTRLQWTGHTWLQTATRDPRQPQEGLTIPADTRLMEQKLICDVYEGADGAGRHLIRAIATAVCESAPSV